jgi:hypothetical protein
MPGSAYHRAGRLATHPAFRAGLLVCPLCTGFCTGSAAAWALHFLAHKPSEEQAWRWLPGKTYAREYERRGWRSPVAMLEAYPDA